MDKDIGTDCDDAGALAILNNLELQGLCRLLGVTHDTLDINGSIVIAAINKWFKRDNIPIGRYEKDDFLYDAYSPFTLLAAYVPQLYAIGVQEQVVTNKLIIIITPKIFFTLATVPSN